MRWLYLLLFALLALSPSSCSVPEAHAGYNSGGYFDLAGGSGSVPWVPLTSQMFSATPDDDPRSQLQEGLGSGTGGVGALSHGMRNTSGDVPNELQDAVRWDMNSLSDIPGLDLGVRGRLEVAFQVHSMPQNSAVGFGVGSVSQQVPNIGVGPSRPGTSYKCGFGSYNNINAGFGTNDATLSNFSDRVMSEIRWPMGLDTASTRAVQAVCDWEMEVSTSIPQHVSGRIQSNPWNSGGLRAYFYSTALTNTDPGSTQLVDVDGWARFVPYDDPT